MMMLSLYRFQNLTPAPPPSESHSKILLRAALQREDKSQTRLFSAYRLLGSI
jgi:hypothetical protein